MATSGDSQILIGQPGEVDLTDADMFVHNDNPQILAVTVDNNHLMSDTFPSQDVAAGATATGSVTASNWPGQSYFDVSFNGGHKIHTLIGTGIYNTSANPPNFADGTTGVVLAPGEPLSTNTDFQFHYFNGPGVLPSLANSFIQANLPAIVKAIAANPITINFNDSVSLKLTSLGLDPATLSCSYAGLSPKQGGNGNLWNVNTIIHAAQGGAVGDLTIKGQTGTFSLSLKDAYFWIQLQADTSMQTNPQITALQCSINDWTIQGTILDILKNLFPIIGQLISLGLNGYRVAGAINTYFNQDIISAINDAIDNYMPHRIMSVRSQAFPHQRSPSVFPTAINLSQWMSNPLIQAKTLSQIRLPGTHDSATYALTSVLSQIEYDDISFLWTISDQSAPANGSWPFTIPPTTTNPLYIGQALYQFVMGTAVNSMSRTQDQDILQQLQSGIRYFDLRVYYDTRDTNFYIQHALRGPLLKDVLAQVQQFIMADPSACELIFMCISHTNLGDFPGQIPNLTSLINAYIQPDNLYYQASPSGSRFDFQTLANTTLGSITNGKPKVMFLNGDTNYSYQDTVTNTDGYANVPFTHELYTVDALEAQQGPPLRTHSEPLWAINWTLGASPATMVSAVLSMLQGQQQWVLQSIATEANNNLPGFLQTYAGTAWNLVTLDWFEYGPQQSLVDLIVGMNLTLQDKRTGHLEQAVFRQTLSPFKATQVGEFY